MLAQFVHTKGWIKEKFEMPWVRQVFLVLIFSIPILLLWVNLAFAQDAGEILLNKIAELGFWIANLLVGMMSVLISALITVASYNKFIEEPGVLVGWTLVRDIANIFFVVILLVIAFGTILGLDQYHIKKTLPRFVITAVLINFSRLIIGVMIDISQVVMMTFINAIAQVGGGNFLQAFKVNEMFQVSNKFDAAGGAGVITAILVIVLIFIATVLVGMFALLLISRTVMLWILIVLSPIVFLLGTIPSSDFQGHYNEWWGRLKANLVLGPAAAFFLWLALAMIGDGGVYKRIKEGGRGGSSEAEDVLGERGAGITNANVSSIPNLTGFIIAAAMFGAAFQMTQQLAQRASLPGAGKITGGAAGILKAAGRKFSGYAAAERAVKPVLARRREMLAETGLGTGIGRRLDRAYLGAVKMAPGEAGTVAKEKLMAVRMETTKKYQKRMDHLPDKELDEMSDRGGEKGVAAALIQAKRGKRFGPEKAAMIQRAMSGNEQAQTEFKGSLKKNSPELAYNLSNPDQVEAMIRDPEVNLNNLGADALQGASGKVVLEKMQAKMGSKALGKQIENFRDEETRKAALDRLASTIIPDAVRDKPANQARQPVVKRELAAAQQEVATLKAQGFKLPGHQQKILGKERDVMRLKEEDRALEVKIKAGEDLAAVHAKQSGRPDKAVGGIADRAIRRELMTAAMKKEKVSEFKPDAFKGLDKNSQPSPEVAADTFAALGEAFGDRAQEVIDKLSVDQRNALNEGAGKIDVASPDTPAKAVEVKVLHTGSFKDVSSRSDAENIITNAVKKMRPKDLAEVKLLEMDTTTEDMFYEALRKNSGAVKGLTSTDAEPEVLSAIKKKIMDSKDSADGGLKKAVTESVAWNAVKYT